MRAWKLVVLAGCVVALGATTAGADPVFGTSVGYGQALGDEADGRVSTVLYGYGSVGHGWTLGGELAGSLEGYTGGYGCGMATGDVVPSIAVSCLQPGVSAHVLFGSEASPSAAARLRLELGLGATSVFLMPGDGFDTRRDTRASGLLRAMYLVEIGRAFTGQWWIGAQLEERALGLGDTRLARSFGFVLEARSE